VEERGGKSENGHFPHSGDGAWEGSMRSKEAVNALGVLYLDHSQIHQKREMQADEKGGP